MTGLSGRLKREHATLACMTEIYCANHHESAGRPLCPDCEVLLRYAEMRLLKCPYGDAKPTCANCPVHCYKQAQRKQVRAVMRYAGPRMVRRHPIRSLTHLRDKLRAVMHPMELRRQRGS